MSSVRVTHWIDEGPGPCKRGASAMEPTTRSRQDCGAWPGLALAAWAGELFTHSPLPLFSESGRLVDHSVWAALHLFSGCSSRALVANDTRCPVNPWTLHWREHETWTTAAEGPQIQTLAGSYLPGTGRAAGGPSGCSGVFVVCCGSGSC